MEANHRPALGAVRSSRRGPLRRLRLAAGVLMVVLAAELVYIALASPRLAVSKVTVRGDRQIAGAVAEAIRLPANTNVLRAPLDVVKEQAEGIPAVREARVSRGFPDRLTVTVDRREAVAVIRGAERAILVDGEGVAFTVPEEWGWGLPEMVGPQLGDEAMETAGAAAEIEVLLTVLRALGTDPGLRATRLQLGSDRQIEVTLASGARVNLGEESELGVKVRLLAAAVEQIGANRIARLDLADPKAAFWEPRDDVVAAAVR